jgi:quinolinate synthase
MQTYDEWAREIRTLAGKRRAVILAHNYQVPWIQDVADYVGDSLQLSQQAAATDADTIVFCGVHFMAETAKILSPEKRVLIPDLDAGCSLASAVTAEDVRRWRDEHPGALVVSYVNTSAEVKAESDVCCTSSNAVDVIWALPEDREILFLPDMFLGAHVERQTGRKMHLWMAECHVHAGIGAQEMRMKAEADPEAEILIHPECGCSTAAMYLMSDGVLPAERTKILSTGGMVKESKDSAARKFLVATETGILHQLRKGNPDAEFEAINEYAVCQYMKRITPAKLLRSLQDEVFEVTVPEHIQARARRAVQRMVAISPASARPAAVAAS